MFYATLTFILIDHGCELVRIEGCPGVDFFWPMSDQIIEKMDRTSKDGAMHRTFGVPRQLASLRNCHKRC